MEETPGMLIPPTPELPESAFPPPNRVQKTSGMAIASLTCAIVGFCLPLVGVVGLVLGIIALAQIRRAPEQRSGRDLATAGVIVGIVSSLFMFFFVGEIFSELWWDASPAAREKYALVTSSSNCKQLITAVLIYSKGHDGKLPPMKTIKELQEAVNVPDNICIKPHTTEWYAVNPSLSGKKWRNFPNAEKTAVVYEATPYPDGKRVVGFLDGHVGVFTDKYWPAVKAASGIP